MCTPLEISSHNPHHFLLLIPILLCEHINEYEILFLSISSSKIIEHSSCSLQSINSLSLWFYLPADSWHEIVWVFFRLENWVQLQIGQIYIKIRNLLKPCLCSVSSIPTLRLGFCPSFLKDDESHWKPIRILQLPEYQE